MITVRERPLGRRWDSGSAEIGYVVICSAGENEDEVEAAVEAEAPESYRGFTRGKIAAEEINFDDDGDPCMWDVKVPYGVNGGSLVIPQTGEVQWSGTTAGGTQHITTSPLGIAAEVFRDPTAAAPPAGWGEAIGQTNDGVEGVDIVVPIFAFRATKYVAEDEWPSLMAAMAQLTGRVNNATWTADAATFAAGEVLFMGGTWAKRTDIEPNDYEVTLEFMASPNVDDLEIGGINSPTAIIKDGWQLLDVHFEHTETGGYMVQKPTIAAVHTVYGSGNFGALGV